MLLARNEDAPKARVVVYTAIGHYLVTSERLFKRVYVRCSDVILRDDYVVVGLFDSDGLRVHHIYPNKALGASANGNPIRTSSA